MFARQLACELAATTRVVGTRKVTGRGESGQGEFPGVDSFGGEG